VSLAFLDFDSDLNDLEHKGYMIKVCMHRAKDLDSFEAEKEGEGSLRVVEAGEGRGSVSLRLRHILETTYASHVLQISCTLWVYNCAGLPIALQQSIDEEERGETVTSRP